MKVNTILVPTDFSPYANNALYAAKIVAKKTDALIKIYYNSKFPMALEDMNNQLREFYEEHFPGELMAQEQMAAIRANPEFEGVKMQFEIGYGNFMANLSDKVEKENIDLIMMGTHGSDRLEDYVIGSTTLKVLRLAKCPVFAIKEPLPNFELNNVIFASNFKKEALPALKNLVDFAAPWNATIHLLNIDVNHKFVDTPALFKKSISDFTELCGDNLGIVYSYQQLNISEGIEHIEKVYNADLIAIGTHYREYSNTMYTSFITESVIHATEAPVLTMIVGTDPEDEEI